MGEAATESTGVNPNVEVGDEPTISTGAGSQLTFDDLERVTAEEDRKPKPKPKPKEEKPLKEAAWNPDDAPDPKDQREPKEEKEPKPKDKEPQAAQPKEGQPKPKIHKLKIGDQIMDVAGDATFTIPVAGKKEEVPLQDLVNDYNGRTEWHRRFSEVDVREKEFSKQKESLDKLVSNVYEKVQTDPDAAFDFLAEMTKQDPIAMKEGMLRSQIEALLPLAAMSEEEREAYIKDQVRNWRDKLHESRTKSYETEQKADEEALAKQQLMDIHGIDEARYAKAEQVARDFLTKQHPEFDGAVTKEQVLYVDRKLMAWDVINNTVPHLVNHARYDSIVEDVVTDLLRHPELTPETLAKQLSEVFGEEDKALKNLGRKAATTATASHAEAPADSRPRQEHSATFFDDML